MKVNIEYVKWLQSERDKINKVPLRDIQFYEKGKLVEFSDILIENFEFIGLINTDFITKGFYSPSEEKTERITVLRVDVEKGENP